jgi:putative transposase
MRKSRLSEGQIVAILREQEAGVATGDICRKHGIRDARFSKWKARYGGLEVFEAKGRTALEEENAQLKRLLAEAMLDDAALKELLLG